MIDAAAAAHLLAEAGALHDGAAELSTVGVDVCRLMARTDLADAVVAALLDRLAPYVAADATVVSPNTASLPVATLVATALGRPLAYLRPKPKGHGKQRQVEGVLPVGGDAVLVFDTVRAGAEILEAVGIVARHGARARVAGALLVKDRSDADAALADSGVPLVALTDRAASEAALAAAREPAAEVSARSDSGNRPPRSLSGSAASPARTAPTAPAEAGRQELRVRVARALLSIGAVTVNAERPYRYTSGILSPIYTDNRLLISHRAAWDAIVDGFSGAVAEIAATDGLDALAGAATAGVPHAVRIARRLDLPLLFVDLSASDDGDAEPGALHGRLEAGARVAIIEDLVTTGKSVVELDDALRARGARVGWCVAIFTYDVAGARATFAARGLQFEVLCDIDTLLEVAVQDGNITEGDRAAVREWLADRRGWSDRAEARLAAAGPA